MTLAGEVIYTKKIDEILDPAKYYATPSTQFLPSKDERYFLIDPPDSSRGGMKGLDGQVNTITLYDTISGKLYQCVPNNLYAQNPRWLNEREIIFEGVTEEELSIKGNSAPLHIYKISIDTKKLKILLKNASSPSVTYY